MTSSEHSKLEQLFSAALEKTTKGEREAFLEGACGDDDALRTHLQQLLKGHDQAGSFLDGPPVDPDETLEAATATTATISTGRKIGRYKILQEIGEGGFGFVYMAEQEEPVRRKVALKIIKLGMDTRQVIARFEAERQALALMDHPNISRVFDAGATETGRPYFVMELVKGVTITQYCNDNNLAIPERVALMLPVCHAVQHAHQKGVIHRDLKPSNVLVTLDESDPVPKVIDFGIAKATSQRLTEKTLFTGFRDFIGTPEYMSPDQAQLSGLDVDTRTDIYSLGVLLYELLTGATPFDAKTLRDSSFEEIRRTIREVDPPRPSLRLLMQRDGRAAAPAKSHETGPVALSRSVRGDLDWIVMKAMEKDRTRRYATAKDLADDIERHLRNEPVLAGPPGVGYKFRKFVRRHRVSVLAGSLVGAALLTGITLAMFGLIEANRSRDALALERDAAQASATEAQRQAAKSETLSGFLRNMLQSVDPTKARGREVTVLYVLDEASGHIEDGTLAAQPDVEASVRMTLGETYEALGRYADAETHLNAAVAIRNRRLGEAHPDALRSSRVLAGVLRLRGKFSEAEALLRETSQIQQRVLGSEHIDTLATMNELALALWGPGRYAEADTLHRQTLAIQRRVLGEYHVDTLESIGHLGMVCRALDKNDEAQTLLREALERCQRTLGDEHPTTTMAMNNLGLFLEDGEDHEQAEGLFRRSYELDRRILGPDHPRTLVTMYSLLRVLRAQQKVAETRPIFIDRLAHYKRAAESPEATAVALHTYAWELLNGEPEDLRDPQAALPFARRAVELDGGVDANMLDTLAMVLHQTGDASGAIETLRQAVAVARAGGLFNRAELEDKLISYLMESGDLVGAATVSLGEAATSLGETLIPGSIPGEALSVQGESLIRQGRYTEAINVLSGCLGIQQKGLPEGHWRVADTTSLLGAARAGTGAFEEAEGLVLEGFRKMEFHRGVPDERRTLAIRRIVRLYRAWGKPDLASTWLKRLPAPPGDRPDGG